MFHPHLLQLCDYRYNDNKCGELISISALERTKFPYLLTYYKFNRLKTK